MPTNILMPALSPTMEKGNLAKWLKKEGDNVKAGDVIAEIETDKATMEYEAVDEGKIGKLLIPEGAEGVKVNSPIARLITEDGDDTGTQAAKPAAVPAPAVPDQKAKAAAAPPNSKPAVKSGNGSSAPHAESRVFASPLAKRIAEGKGIDLSRISGSGSASMPLACSSCDAAFLYSRYFATTSARSLCALAIFRYWSPSAMPAGSAICAVSSSKCFSSSPSLRVNCIRV